MSTIPELETSSPTPRVVDIPTGLVMVVTDLHGDLPLYTHYRDLYLALRAQGLVKTLVLTGDYIHSDGSLEEDGSLDIVLDLIQLQTALGQDLIVLLGNHEMPHIYHVPLSRGQREYTPRFEASLGAHRTRVLRFFRERPFMARTAGGVTLCHAGAFPEARDPAALATLLGFSHQKVLATAREAVPPERRQAVYGIVERAAGEPYSALAQKYCAVETPDDPRYADYLVGVFAGYDEDFELLWSMLFSQNELASGEASYANDVDALLSALSRADSPQRVLVTGHIGCRGGYRVLARGQQLRIASGAHAYPYASARYLLFDATQEITTAEDLLPGLADTFSKS
jgi:hypothetical protein